MKISPLMNIYLFIYLFINGRNNKLSRLQVQFLGLRSGPNYELWFEMMRHQHVQVQHVRI